MFDKTAGDKTFEVSLVIKDADGNPTNQRKSFASDDPVKVWQFFNRFQGKPKRKKRKDKSKPTTKEDAEKILSEMFDNSENE